MKRAKIASYSETEGFLSSTEKKRKPIRAKESHWNGVFEKVGEITTRWSVLVPRARVSPADHALSLHPRRIMQASASLGGSAATYCRR